MCLIVQQQAVRPEALLGFPHQRSPRISGRVPQRQGPILSRRGYMPKRRVRSSACQDLVLARALHCQATTISGQQKNSSCFACCKSLAVPFEPCTMAADLLTTVNGPSQTWLDLCDPDNTTRSGTLCNQLKSERLLYGPYSMATLHIADIRLENQLLVQQHRLPIQLQTNALSEASQALCH